MRVDARQDEAGAVGPADSLERAWWALDAALHHLIVVISADGTAVGAEGDDVADPVIAPGVVDAVRLQVVVELRLILADRAVERRLKRRLGVRGEICAELDGSAQ